MKSIEVQSEIGFADGEILGCERIGSALIVRVRAWNSKNLRVEFRNVQLVLDLMPGDISGFYRYDEDTELICKALGYAYDEPPKQHPYKHFAFMNTVDEPCLEIVAAETEVIAE
jgi:predicted GNAT superfamily acetyltransferase